MICLLLIVLPLIYKLWLYGIRKELYPRRLRLGVGLGSYYVILSTYISMFLLETRKSYSNSILLLLPELNKKEKITTSVLISSDRV